MRTILIILFLIGLSKSSLACCSGDDRTLTERLFQNNTGTIFTCKILTFSMQTLSDNFIVSRSEESIIGTATAEITTVYFGIVDTNIVTLRTGSYLIVGNIYLIYTRDCGSVFSFGGNCDRWSKQVTDSPITTNELQTLMQFSNIFKNKSSGQFLFRNSKNMVIAQGEYKKGTAIKTWKHFYDNGIIKAEFNLTKNVNSQYFENGFIKSRSTIKRNIGYYEQFSNKVNGQLTFTNREVKNDIGSIMTISDFYDNGRMKNLSSQVNIYSKDSSYSTGKTGDYKEFYENGNLKLKGQYNNNKRIGLWKWYDEYGKFNKRLDYKDGIVEQ